MNNISSPVASGDQGLATQYNDLRSDAIGITNINVSGPAFAVGDVLFNDNSGGFRQAYNEIPPWFTEFRIAAAAYTSGGAGRAYKPGSLVNIYSGLTPGATYYQNGTTISTTPNINSVRLGKAIDSTTLLFNPQYSDLKIINGTSVGAVGVRNLMYQRPDGLWDTYTRGHFGNVTPKVIAFCASSTATSGPVTLLPPGNKIGGFGTLTAGQDYFAETYSSTASIINARHPNSVYLGKADSVLTTLNFQIAEDPKIVDEPFMATVTAGENWTAGDFLYLASDGLVRRSHSDSPESGIAERLMIAATTHTGGSGSAQPVYLPGATIVGLLTGTAGNRLFNTVTPGASVVNVPNSYDEWYSCYGHFTQTNVFYFHPQHFDFLESGVQEKGFCGAGIPVSGPSSGSNAVNYKRVMSFVPTSITFTATTSIGIATGPTVLDSTRFGFSFNLTVSAVPARWYGTYQTVGN